MYELEELKRCAYAGEKPRGMDVHESAIYYIMKYCYDTYRKDPTEKTKKRLQDFAQPVIDFHYGRKD